MKRKKPNKKRISIMLDQDILEAIKAAAVRSRIPYQSLINAWLYIIAVKK